MKHHLISLRRRHLLIAGFTGIVTPATLFAATRKGTERGLPAVTGLGGIEEKLVVSGRILGTPANKPLAGAVIEVWHADANGNCSGSTHGNPGDTCARVTTDADGRFMFMTLAPTGHSGLPRLIYYRASHEAHEGLLTQLHFAPAHGIPAERVAQLRRDDTGVWRATFGLTLA